MTLTFDDEKLADVMLKTRVVLNEYDRITFVNDPDRSPGPRLLLLGLPSGNVCRLGHDVSSAVAGKIANLDSVESALSGPSSVPMHRREYLELLGAERSVLSSNSGVTYVFDHDTSSYQTNVELICSGTAAGDRVISKMEDEGMPHDLRAMGFREPTDIWKPWCVAINAGEIVSIGFTARLGDRGAESGVVTVPGMRGRGYAAAAVSGWAGHPDLGDRVRFYSADTTNHSSQKVAERLDLRFLGASFTIF